MDCALSSNTHLFSYWTSFSPSSATRLLTPRGILDAVDAELPIVYDQAEDGGIIGVQEGRKRRMLARVTAENRSPWAGLLRREVWAGLRPMTGRENDDFRKESRITADMKEMIVSDERVGQHSFIHARQGIRRFEMQTSAHEPRPALTRVRDSRQPTRSQPFRDSTVDSPEGSRSRQKTQSNA